MSGSADPDSTAIRHRSRPWLPRAPAPLARPCCLRLCGDAL